MKLRGHGNACRYDVTDGSSQRDLQFVKLHGFMDQRQGYDQKLATKSRQMGNSFLNPYHDLVCESCITILDFSIMSPAQLQVFLSSQADSYSDVNLFEHLILVKLYIRIITSLEKKARPS
jgi:hypothetical protein